MDRARWTMLKTLLKMRCQSHARRLPVLCDVVVDIALNLSRVC
jgi:hypothetical protein